MRETEESWAQKALMRLSCGRVGVYVLFLIFAVFVVGIWSLIVVNNNDLNTGPLLRLTLPIAGGYNYLVNAGAMRGKFESNALNTIKNSDLEIHFIITR